MVSNDIKRETRHNGKLNVNENNDQKRACDKKFPSEMWMIRLPVQTKFQNARGKLQNIYVIYTMLINYRFFIYSINNKNNHPFSE